VKKRNVSVKMALGSRSVSVTMKKTGAGSWKGTARAADTEARLAKLFPDVGACELEGVVDNLLSQGMDMHRELMLDED
jgi:hypothetical protein